MKKLNHGQNQGLVPYRLKHFSSQLPKNRVNFQNQTLKTFSKISYDYKFNNGYKSPILGSIRTRWIWVQKITKTQGPKQN